MLGSLDSTISPHHLRSIGDSAADVDQFCLVCLLGQSRLVLFEQDKDVCSVGGVLTPVMTAEGHGSERRAAAVKITMTETER